MITVEVDTREAAAFLRALHSDQIPYATSLALNDTALAVQRAQRQEIGERFTLRRRDWAMRNVKIGREDFATKTRLRAIVRMEAPGDPSRSDILGKFERATTKRPRDGARLAVPDEAQRTGTGVIPRSKRPRAFNFKPRHRSGSTTFRRKGRTRSGATVFIGEKNTFMILNPDGTGGVFQRVGIKVGRKRYRGPRPASNLKTRRVRDMNVKRLFQFTPSAKVDARLHFESTAKGVIIARFNRSFEAAMTKAIASARR